MKLKVAHIKNFRRLENVQIDFDQTETVFVGPNNSGKTSATTAFRLFLEKQEFRIHDFSVARIREIDALHSEESLESAPAIELDLWFSIAPETEYYRVATLLPNSLSDLNEVGIRLSYQLKDVSKLRSDYSQSIKADDDGNRTKSITQYLSGLGGLNKHFEIVYFALERTEDEPTQIALDPKEAKQALNSLIRIDFVDAQRNIHDQEVGRSNRLSQAFAAFYKKNLEQADISDDANLVIDANNDRLTEHYGKTFESLMGVISRLGVPSVNDREMKIVSTLSPEVALQGNTELLYVDADMEHELPEAYNGLGFKNLVYIAIQVSHFHLQWMRTQEKRPLCQIIFIEEPEVHLHAQVQQAFIANIWNIVRQASEEAGDTTMIPQLCITTHSSHILDAIDFHKTRYFRRCEPNSDTPSRSRILNTTVVLSLNDFVPDKCSASGEAEDSNTTRDFLLKYLKLTHCDLFFADAAILIEGTAEKLLLPKMIQDTASGLTHNYLTILEVGGAYAHRFASLFEFLGLPYLVITDIDSVDPAHNRSACKANTPGCVSSNAAIKFFVDIDAVSELAQMDEKQRILASETCYLAFQQPTEINVGTACFQMHGRTFEETFIHENLSLFRSGELNADLTLSAPEGADSTIDYDAVYELVQSKSFKKTEFALDLASTETDWKTPCYIESGLKWLETKLSRNDPITNLTGTPEK